MSAGVIAVLAVVAVLGFWIVGAYNRLQRLRNAAANAYARFDALGSERLIAAQRLCDVAVQRGIARDATELARAALRQAVGAAEAARAKPLQRRTMLGVAMAAQVLQAALDALRLRGAGQALPVPATAADLAQPAAPPADSAAEAPAAAAQDAAVLAVWEEACTALDAQAAALALARADYDGCVAAYNDAAAQVPTRFVALLFSLPPASALDPHLSAESTLEAPTKAP